MVDSESNKYSLRKQYLFFTGIVSLIIIIGLIWASYSTYTSFKRYYADDICLQAQEMLHVLDEKISFIEHFLQFIGFQIKNSNINTIQDISQMIKYHKKDHDDDAITWNIVDYINTSGALVADSKVGIRNPIQIAGKRNWIELAKDNPWKLQFSAPSLGLITGDYILPSGIGVYDEDNGKFYGFLSSGISIEKLTTSLIKLVNNRIVFALYDDSFNNIISSDPFINIGILAAQLDKHKEELNFKAATNNIVELEEHMKIGNIIFSHYSHSPKYPFWFLIGYDQNFYSNDLWSEISPKLIVNMIMWLMFAGILAYLSYQVVRPIIILGKAADNISRGKNVILPNFKTKELNLLAKQLKMISQIHYNLRSKQAKLSRANAELSTANEFINTNMSFLSHELINPTSSILEFSKMLSSRIKNKIDQESQEYLSIISMAALHLSKQLSFFIKLFKFQAERKIIENKPLTLKQLIEWNLSMIMHHVKYKRVSIRLEVENNLKMFGDEIMIGQLFQNIAANGAKYNKIGGSLLVKAFVNAKNEIEIHFIDTGIGIGKVDLNNIFKIFKRATSIKKTLTVGYGIGLAYAQRCVEAHEGKILVSSKLGKGTTFKIIFPKERTLIN